MEGSGSEAKEDFQVDKVWTKVFGFHVGDIVVFEETSEARDYENENIVAGEIPKGTRGVVTELTDRGVEIRVIDPGTRFFDTTVEVTKEVLRVIEPCRHSQEKNLKRN